MMVKYRKSTTKRTHQPTLEEENDVDDIGQAYYHGDNNDEDEKQQKEKGNDSDKA